MAFGRIRNRHDTWQSFCEKHRETLESTGLPKSVTHNEQRFRMLIEEGEVLSQGVRYALRDVGNDQWTKLAQFAERFLDVFESYAPLECFPAFREERRRRQTPSGSGPHV
jgi:hypothetical protein